MSVSDDNEDRVKSICNKKALSKSKFINNELNSASTDKESQLVIKSKTKAQREVWSPQISRKTALFKKINKSKVMILRNGFSPGYSKTFRSMHKLLGESQKLASEDLKLSEIEVPLIKQKPRKMIGLVEIGIENPGNLLSELNENTARKTINRYADMHEYQFKAKSSLKDPRFRKMHSSIVSSRDLKRDQNKMIWVRKPDFDAPYFETPKKRLMTNNCSRDQFAWTRNGCVSHQWGDTNITSRVSNSRNLHSRQKLTHKTKRCYTHQHKRGSKLITKEDIKEAFKKMDKHISPLAKENEDNKNVENVIQTKNNKSCI